MSEYMQDKSKKTYKELIVMSPWMPKEGNSKILRRLLKEFLNDLASTVDDAMLLAI